MNARPVDANGDILPVAFQDDLLTGTKAVAQVAKQRLQFYYGEWWEDPTTGFRILPFLQGGIRSDKVKMLAQYLSTYIAGTEGVTSVTNSTITVVGHKMTFKAVLHTGEGSEVLEVNLDGLFTT